MKEKTLVELFKRRDRDIKYLFTENAREQMISEKSIILDCIGVLRRNKLKLYRKHKMGEIDDKEYYLFVQAINFVLGEGKLTHKAFQ